MNDDLPVIDELERMLIASCYGPPASDRERRRRQRLRRRWAAAGISAAACTAAAIAAIVLASGSVEPSAAQALDRAATAAANGPAQSLRPGQYWYTRTIVSTDQPVPVVPTPTPSGPAKLPAMVNLDLRQSSETWIGIDGTIRQRNITLSERFASPAGRKRWLASRQALPSFGTSDSITGGAGWFPPQSSGLGDLGDGLFSYRELVSLPIGVPELRAAIERAQTALGGRQQHGLSMQASRGVGVAGMQVVAKPSAVDRRAIEDLNTIASLLATPVAPGVRAALYRVAASLPGVEYDGPARDPLGRAGVAVSVGRSDSEMRMIFDPHTGALLSSSYRPGQAGRGVGLGGLTETIVAQAMASSIDSLPPDVKPIRGKMPVPQTISISPHRGATNTVFSLELSAPAGTHARAPAPPASAMLNGPTAPNCRSYLFPPPAARIGKAVVSSVDGRFAYRYRLAPSSIGRRRWCAGRYLLQVGAQNQQGVYFDVS
jgi:hypothetical protein